MWRAFFYWHDLAHRHHWNSCSLAGAVVVAVVVVVVGINDFLLSLSSHSATRTHTFPEKTDVCLRAYVHKYNVLCFGSVRLSRLAWSSHVVSVVHCMWPTVIAVYIRSVCVSIWTSFPSVPDAALPCCKKIQRWNTSIKQQTTVATESVYLQTPCWSDRLLHSPFLQSSIRIRRYLNFNNDVVDFSICQHDEFRHQVHKQIGIEKYTRIVNKQGKSNRINNIIPYPLVGTDLENRIWFIVLVDAGCRLIGVQHAHSFLIFFFVLFGCAPSVAACVSERLCVNNTFVWRLR